ncbi:MAG: agmatinase [Acidimicrobiia bacterium]|nr:agmatinase [Acidimicrobiia bacterium]
MGSRPEPVYAGATSFLRRRYSRDLVAESPDVVVSGIPYDLGTTNRPGARFGPRAIREASANLAFGRVWPWNLDPFETLSVIDWGDVVFDEGYPDRMVEAVEAHADRIIATGARMLTLGGDHFVTLPLLRAHARKHGPVALVHLDAHSDAWRDERHNHGSMFFHAVEEGLVDASRSVQIGLRTFNEEDHGYTILTAPWVHEHGPGAVAEEIRRVVGSHTTYLTIDIDCLDPAYAPGTGTPVVGGLTTSQVQRVVYALAGAPEPSFVGMDVVEVSPPYDAAGITSLAAATLALEWICLLACRLQGLGAPNAAQGGSGRVSAGRALR